MNAQLPTEVATADAQFEVRRAWPRGRGHVLLELRGTDGGTVAGQWFEQPDELQAAVRATPAPARAHGDVLLQPDGADAKLRVLPELLAGADAQLVAHRPSRRAVVRHVGAAGAVVGYSKVVRAARAADVARRGRLVARLLGGGVAVPRPAPGTDLRRGVLRWSVVPGTTLMDLGRSPAWTPARAVTAWRAVGELLGVLGEVDAAAVPAVHGVDDELRALVNWVEPAVGFGLLDERLAARATTKVAAQLLEGAGPRVQGVLHRDLHDKQLLLDDAGGIGVIDVDTLAVGERALDVANLLVHLELRELQGSLGRVQAAASRDALKAAVADGAVPDARLEAYAGATRLRLAGVYAFRPRWRGVAAVLLERAAAGSRAR